MKKMACSLSSSCWLPGDKKMTTPRVVLVALSGRPQPEHSTGRIDVLPLEFTPMPKLILCGARMLQMVRHTPIKPLLHRTAVDSAPATEDVTSAVYQRQRRIDPLRVGSIFFFRLHKRWRSQVARMRCQSRGM